MDEFENQPQQPEPTQDASGTSRRNFLKVAVVSSAAAAAAVGGAGIAVTTLSSRAPTGLSKLLVLGTQISTQIAEFSDTNPDKLTCGSGPYTDTESLYFWAWFQMPANNAGTKYTIELSSPNSLPSGGVDYQSTGQNDTPTGNNVQVYYDQPLGCPTSKPTPNAQQASLPIPFTPSTNLNTVLVSVHLQANVSAGSSFTMTLTLSGGGYTQNATATATFK